MIGTTRAPYYVTAAILAYIASAIFVLLISPALGATGGGAATGGTAGTTGSIPTGTVGNNTTAPNNTAPNYAGVGTIQNNTTVPTNGAVPNNTGVGTIQNNTVVPSNGAVPNNTGGGTLQNNTTMPGNATMSPATMNKPNGANWAAEDIFWQSHYSSRPYFTNSTAYAVYQPAYQYGVNLFNQFGGQPFDSINQTQLQAGWAQAHGNSNLDWTQAQAAARDAYMRLYDRQHSTNQP